MADNREPPLVLGDSVSSNVIAESFSRLTVLASGLVTSALLFQATEQSWSLADYGYLKTLMYWDSILSVLILLGLGTAVIKSVSDNAHRPDRIGAAITMSLVTVTATALIVVVFTVPLADFIGFLALPNQPMEVTQQLRALWVLVVISMLPGAYMSVAMSAFSGLQRMRRNLTINAVYNASRALIIVVLFVYGMIAVAYVLYVYLFTTILGFATAGLMLRQDLKQSDISLTLRGWHLVSGPLYRIASIFFVLEILSLFGNFVAPLLVGVIGTIEELAVYDVAFRTMTTIKQLVHTPLAILLPNLSGMHSRGEYARMKERFNESIRVVVPFLVFIVSVCIFFGEAVLMSIYGARANLTVRDMSPASFFVLMAPNLLLASVFGLYNTVLNAATQMRSLFVIGLTTTLMQISWVVIMAPHYGTVAVALLWIPLLASTLMSHVYCARSTGLSISQGFLLRLLMLCLTLTPLTWMMSVAASYTISYFSWMPFLEINRLAAVFRLAFAVPLWYAFVALCLLTGTMMGTDIENLRRFLRRIPPVWWISRPMLDLIERSVKKAVGNRPADC